jgi:CBS domain-containing protein
MKVNKVMTHAVRLLKRDQTIGEAAVIMAEIDSGALPVGDDDKLVGMITDRDIVIRGLAQGKSVDTKVADIMSKDAPYCFDPDEVVDAARNMGNAKVRRLPVLNKDKRMVGIVSLGDLARDNDPSPIGQTVTRVSAPGGKRDQSTGPDAIEWSLTRRLYR